MVELFSRYEAGNQVWAGIITGSSDGVEGINPIVDRLNSISDNNTRIIGNVSGTSSVLFCGTGSIDKGCFIIENKSSVPGDVIQGRFWLVN